ncbi:MAG: hypothetical protein ABSG31_06820 [Tepidisphaeraceae bacterium]|jgi:hypothetical protein
MQKRIFLRLNIPRLGAGFMERVRACGSFVPVEDGLSMMRFDFEDVVFDHAALLLGKNHLRFGQDISLYLSTVRTFFERSEIEQYLFVPESNSDFKRRCSEDLGVAMGCLFVVCAAQVLWETISQIPQDRKLAKRRPDFICYDPSANKYILETKGTSHAENVDGAVLQAKEQLAGYPEPALGKLAFVTFFMSATSGIPSFLFVDDPPVPNILISREMAQALHVLLVLDFIGFARSLDLLKRIRALQLKAIELKDASGLSRADDNRLKDAGFDLQAAFGEELRAAGRVSINKRTFVGRWLLADNRGREVNVFLGVSEEHLQDELRGWHDVNRARTSLQRLKPLENFQADIESARHSIFSDGTIFLITSDKEHIQSIAVA